MARIPFLGKRSQATAVVPLTDVLALLESQQKSRQQGQQAPMPIPDDWWQQPFGPGARIKPAAINSIRPDTERSEPRIYEYPVAWNLQIAQNRLIPWSTLRNASQAPVVRPIITKRLKELSALRWDIAVRQSAIEKAVASGTANGTASAADSMMARFAPDIERLTAFWQEPDPEQGFEFSEWLWMAAEEQLVLDAVAIYPRTTYGGDLYGLRILDGSTIKPLLDAYGARPVTPSPAYQQILYGFPRGEFTADLDGTQGQGFTADQLIYRRRGLRTHSPYGLSPVEESLADLDLLLKRHGWLRAEYTEGTLAEAYLRSPHELAWTPQQLREYERDLNDDMSGNTAERHRLRILPPGLDPVNFGDTAERYKPEYDLFLIQLLCAHFGESASEMGFTIGKGALGGSGVHQAQKQTSAEAGLFPDARWWAGVLTRISRNYLNAPSELEFKFLDVEQEDEKDADTIAGNQVNSGRKTLNEDRDRLGLPRYDDPLADEPMVITPSGFFMVTSSGQKKLADAQSAAGGQDGQQKGQGQPAGQPDGTMENQPAALSVNADEHGNPSGLNPGKQAVEDHVQKLSDASGEVKLYRRWLRKNAGADRVFTFRSDPALVKSLLTVDEAGNGIAFKQAAADHAEAAKVYSQMLDDYPADSIAWVTDASWSLQDVDTSQLDMDDQDSWRATHQPDIVRRFQRRLEAGRQNKPAVVVREPGKRRLLVIDGHHRTLAAVHAGTPLRAWVGVVPAGTGPWEETHSSQIHVSSKMDSRTMLPKAASLPRFPGWQKDRQLARAYAARLHASMAAAVDPGSIARQFAAQHMVKAAAPDTLGWLSSGPWGADIERAVRQQMTGLWREAWYLGNASAMSAIRGETAFWGDWSPGDPESAMVAGEGYAALLRDGDVTIRSVTDSRLGELAARLSDALSAGNSTDDLASAIGDLISNGWQDAADTIARTEISRVVNASTLAAYDDQGVNQVEWLVAPEEACEICLDNGSAGPVARGSDFPSGDTQPPAHPRCRCALMPADNGGA